MYIYYVLFQDTDISIAEQTENEASNKTSILPEPVPTTSHRNELSVSNPTPTEVSVSKSIKKGRQVPPNDNRSNEMLIDAYEILKNQQLQPLIILNLAEFM